jgi:protein-tyrosine phosphatase
VVPGVAQLNAAVAAIDELAGSRPTLVCCAAGYSRSAAAVAAWLIASGRAASVDESIALIRAHRPRIVLGPADRARLEEWRRSGGAGCQAW